jgi:hypothetical protein
MKRDAKMACEPSKAQVQQYLEKQVDFQTDCFELLRYHNTYPEIEWRDKDGPGTTATRWSEKAQLKLVNRLSFSETGKIQFPPPNTRLCDELVYLATKSLNFGERALWYPYDFNKKGDINPNRVSSGAAPIIWAHGLPFFPVYKGYYILCGREHAICIGWLINEYHRNVTKNHPVWSVGAVIAPESAARAPRTIDRQMRLHQPHGTDFNIRYRGKPVARDVVSADHHHCAVLPHLNRFIQVCPLWMFPGYNVRCGPVNAHAETTTVKRGFFVSKGLGDKYLSLVRPYANIFSDQPAESVESTSKDTSDSGNLDDSSDNVKSQEPEAKEQGNDHALALPAETAMADTSMVETSSRRKIRTPASEEVKVIAQTTSEDSMEQIVMQQPGTDIANGETTYLPSAIEKFSEDIIIEQPEPQIGFQSFSTDDMRMT